MAAERWTSMKVVVVGPSGRETPLEARLPEPERRSGPLAVVPIVSLIVLVGIGVLFPPVLLLNLPILFVRSALGLARMARYERVSLDAFACPDCSGTNPSAVRKGTLPLDTTCARCGARLTVGQVVRRYTPDALRVAYPPAE